MHAIRAAHAFDGTQFLPGGATVVVDGDRIVGVHTGRVDLPDGVEVTEYDGTVLPGLFDCHTHLVADSTFGGLERAGTMTDEAIDAVIVRVPPRPRRGRRDDRPGLGRPRLPDAGFPACAPVYPAWSPPGRRSRLPAATATSSAARWPATCAPRSRSMPSGALTW